MITKFSKKWLIAFVSAVTVFGGYKIAKACADDGWYLFGTSNIAPEAFVADKSYTPFFYSDMFYYDINYDTNHDTRFNLTNTEEWSQYLSNTTDTATLNYLLQKVDLAGVEKIKSKMSNNSVRLPDSLQTCFAKLNVKKTETQNFINYLVLANEAEAFSALNYSYYWDYEPQELPKSQSINALESKFKVGLTASKDDFMRKRYFFQLVRYYYFYNTPLAIKCFEENKAQFKPDNMFYRTMAYAAGAYYKQKEYGRANYYYSLVFAGSNLLKTVAHWSFHPQDEADWGQTLALCKSPEEKATLWQMLGIFYSDEMRSMKEIYKLTPQSPQLDVLLTRYLNIYETGGYYYEEEKVKDSIRASKKPDIAWIQTVAKEGEISNPFLWNVSAGYLAFLQDDNTTAKSFYALAEKVIDRKNSLAREQLRLLNLLNKVGELKTITPENETALLPDLQWLFFDTKENTTLRTENAVGWIRNAMSKKYASQKEMQKSECFLSNQSFYNSAENIRQYRSFLEQTSFTPYEDFCRKIATIKLNDVYIYLAVRETIQDKDLELAHHLFVQANDSIELLGNPFNGKIADCHDCDHQAPQKVKYSRDSFVRTLILMRGNVEKGEDVYNNALLLGNAFYNMSFYGNARYFYEGNIIGQGMSYPGAIDLSFLNLLTDNAIAYKYYTKALQAAQDDEQRAKCYYMLAKCERNKWYNQNYYSFDDNQYQYIDYNGPDFLEWKSFTELKKLSNTKYYMDVIRECGYFRKVVGR